MSEFASVCFASCSSRRRRRVARVVAMRHLKVDYKVDRTPYVHPLGSRAGPTAVALGGALPASPQQFGSHPSNCATAPRFQPTTREPERLPQPERPAHVPPPRQPQPPPPQQPQQHEQQLPPPPQPQPPPSLPEPELYDSLLQLHRLCGGDLTRCIEVAARVHRLPKHRVFEMFRLMLAAQALAPESTPASSASGPPPTAPVHSRLPPPPPPPLEQPATAPPAIGARAWSLAATPRYTVRTLAQGSGLRGSGGHCSGLAAAAPGLPAASPLWQQPQPQRQLQPQNQHQRQHQPLQPPLPQLQPQQHRQQQQVYTQGELHELLQQSAGQKGHVELWQQRVQQATPQQQVPAHMHMQRMQVQPPDQGGEGRLLREAAAEAREAMVPRASRVATLQARQLELQQRQVPLVITPDHCHSRYHGCIPPTDHRECTLTGCRVPGAHAPPGSPLRPLQPARMRVQAQMEREQRELGKLLATMGPDAAAVDVAGGGKAAGGGRRVSGELLPVREWPGARPPRSKYSRRPDASLHGE